MDTGCGSENDYRARRTLAVAALCCVALVTGCSDEEDTCAAVAATNGVTIQGNELSGNGETAIGLFSSAGLLLDNTVSGGAGKLGIVAEMSQGEDYEVRIESNTITGFEVASSIRTTRRARSSAT